MGDNVSIRRFRDSDLDQLVRLINETIGMSYAGVYPPRAVQFFKDFHSEGKIVDRSKAGMTLVIEENWDLVATGSLVGGEILAVFVHPRLQKGGRGALMKALEKRGARKWRGGDRSQHLTALKAVLREPWLQGGRRNFERRGRRSAVGLLESGEAATDSAAMLNPASIAGIPKLLANQHARSTFQLSSHPRPNGGSEGPDRRGIDRERPISVPHPISSSYPLRSGNAVCPLVDGIPTFRRIGEAIDEAQQSVWLTVAYYAPDFRMPDDRGSMFGSSSGDQTPNTSTVAGRFLDLRLTVISSGPEDRGFGFAGIAHMGITFITRRVG